MSIINVLDQQTANLIAAGEVVDRPAAVAKELLENAIDAGSTNITIEIKNGGSTLIRVTDNGKGMSPEDVKNCVLRHATSKISKPEDLEGIVTLGFRGEALAAISAVSRFQIISKEPSADFGTSMSMEGETTISFDEVGCPDGTTITVRDIFFNVPARRKFLKKDATETAYISQFVERIAISYPQIAFKFIADSRIKFSSPGDGSLYNAVYSVFGREFADNLIEVNRADEKVSISGLISHPDASRINRNHQIVFVNNRLVRSRIVSYAVEDAYKSYIMTERFPAFILFITINPYLVDINVHPTKLEVRFVDDASVRESVYFTVKNSIENLLNPIKNDYVEASRRAAETQKVKNAFVPMHTEEAEQQEIQIPKNENKPKPVSSSDNFSHLFNFLEAVPSENKTGNKLIFSDSGSGDDVRTSAKSAFGIVEINKKEDEHISEATVEELPQKEEFESSADNAVKADIGTIENTEINEALDETEDSEDSKDSEDSEETVSVNKYVKYCGIVFDTYIVAEADGNMYIIDKHAAHERILYEALKNTKRNSGTQSVIDIRTLHLSGPQFECALDNMDQLRTCGFDIEEFGDNTLAVRGVPIEFSELDISSCEKILVDMIDDMLVGKSAKLTKEEIFDRTLYTAACKAATKAGYVDSDESYVWLVNKLFELENVFCCPHGRPIIVKYTKGQIEKMFNRT